MGIADQWEDLEVSDGHDDICLRFVAADSEKHVRAYHPSKCRW